MSRPPDLPPTSAGTPSPDTAPPGAAPPGRRPGRLAYLYRRSTHNLPQKLLSLALALGLWFVATGERRATTQQGYDVPLTATDTTGSSGGRAERAVSGLPASVRVTLSGTRARLQALPASSVVARVDVTGVPQGSFDLPVQVQVPGSTRLVRAQPGRVQGYVDTQLTRTLPVTLSVTAPPENRLLRYTLSPTQARVSGPARLVRTVAQVVTGPLALPAGQEDEVALIALNAAGLPVSGLTLTPGRVAARRSDVGELPLRTVRVVLPAPPAALTVLSSSVAPQTVRLVGDPQVLARLATVTANLTYRLGSYTVTPPLLLPAGVRALDTVSVQLEVRATP